jgi:hypothetical protein
MYYTLLEGCPMKPSINMGIPHIRRQIWKHADDHNNSMISSKSIGVVGS